MTKASKPKEYQPIQTKRRQEAQKQKTELTSDLMISQKPYANQVDD